MNQLDALLFSHDETNIQLALQLARGMGERRIVRAYQQLKTCAELFERLYRRPFSVAQLTRYVEQEGMQVRGQDWENPREIPDCLEALARYAVRVLLPNNNLFELPAWLRGCTQIEWLDLSANNLYQLPDWFWELENLVDLNLYDNMLEYIPDSIGRLHRLRCLNLDSDAAPALPDALAELPALHTLWYGSRDSRQPREVPPPIWECVGLSQLILQGRSFHGLSPKIAQLTALRTLCLFNLDIKVLPAEIGQLRELRALHLNGLPALDTLPTWIFDLHQLEELNLRNTLVRRLPISGFERLPRLRRLDLYNTRLVYNPDERWVRQLQETLPDTEIVFDL